MLDLTHERLYAHDFPPSVIKATSVRAKELGADNLGQGIPSFPAPQAAHDAAREALTLRPDIDKYPNYLGLPQLREELARQLSEQNSVKLTPDNILITLGAMEGVQTALISLTHPGDKVALLTPDYATHSPQIMVARAEEVHIPMIEGERWSVDLGRIEDMAKEGLRVLVVTNPGNPTGSVISPEELAEIVKLSKQYGFWVIGDETYSYLTYDNPYKSLAAHLPDHDNIIVVKSFSKEHSMTGWRVGSLITHPDTVDYLARVHDPLVGTVGHINQYAALGALQGSQDHVHNAVAEFTKRRAYVIQELQGMPGIQVAIPEGAYYVFPQYEGEVSSMELARMLLEEFGVNVIPGAIFGTGGEGHFRISLGPEQNVLQSGMRKIKHYFNSQPS